MSLKMKTVSNIFTRKNKTKSSKRTPHQCPVNTGLRCYPIRLGPGIELISTIHELMDDLGIQSLFILSCIGTLSQCTLNSRQLNKKEYEIVSINGTFDSESHNLMGSFADPQTGGLIGGRIHSLTVHTTCELMLAEPMDCTFSRAFDPRTGANELVVRQKVLTDA